MVVRFESSRATLERRTEMKTFDEWWEEYGRCPTRFYGYVTKGVAEDAYEAGIRSKSVVDTPFYIAIKELEALLDLDLELGVSISESVVKAVKSLQEEVGHSCYTISLPDGVKGLTIKFEGVTDEVNISRR